MKALFELAAVAVEAAAVAVLIVGFVFSAVRFLYRSLRGQGLAAYFAFRRELGRTLLLIAANEDRSGVYFKQFDSLIAAVVKAELVDALSADTEDGLTVFGPDDDAFEKLGLFPAVIELIPAEILQAILLYHVVPAEVVAADVVSKPVQVLEMADGGKTLVRSIPRGNFINLAEITGVDIFADNGVFHVIDRVLIPTVIAD